MAAIAVRKILENIVCALIVWLDERGWYLEEAVVKRRMKVSWIGKQVMREVDEGSNEEELLGDL